MLEIEEGVKDVITLEHENALFECKLVYDIKAKCTWHKDGNILKSDKRISITQNGTWHRLEIKRVIISDQGIYTIECRHHETYISVKGHLFVSPRHINNGVFYNKIQHRGPGVETHLKNVEISTGKTIVLEAKFKYESEKYIWFKNNDVILHNQRTTIVNHATGSTITIIDAKPTDTGLYFVVAKTDLDFLSSYADVQVGEYNDESERQLPNIEDNLPDDSEALVGEEIRLVIKANLKTNTIVKWLKNNAEINRLTNKFSFVDYGNNYIGLNILNPTKSSEGEYLVTLLHDGMNQIIYTTTSLTVDRKYFE